MGPALSCFLGGGQVCSLHWTGAGAQTVMRQEGLSLRLGQTLLPLFHRALSASLETLDFLEINHSGFETEREILQAGRLVGGGRGRGSLPIRKGSFCNRPQAGGRTALSRGPRQELPMWWLCEGPIPHSRSEMPQELIPREEGTSPESHTL